MEKIKISEKQVSILLRKMGISCATRGFEYLKKAVMLAASDREYLLLVTKNLYPCVAKEFKTTSTKVERAIRHAIEKAFENYGNCEFNNDVLLATYNSEKGKPTNSEFISSIVEYLKYQNDEE